MLSIGWFTTGRGPGSRGFFTTVQEAIDDGSLDARFEFVFVNRERGEAEGSDGFIDLVRSHSIHLATLSSRRFRREHGGGPFARHRLPYHRRAMEMLSTYEPDVCVMAGYLLFSGTEIVERWPTINLHPAAPWGPAGMWQDVIWDAIERHATESGVRVHVATGELDAGPLVSYCTYPVRGPEFDPHWRDAASRPVEELQAEGEDNALFSAIRREGLRRERPLLVETLRALADGRRVVRCGSVEAPDGGPAEPLCLNDAVEAALGPPGQ